MALWLFRGMRNISNIILTWWRCCRILHNMAYLSQCKTHSSCAQHGFSLIISCRPFPSPHLFKRGKELACFHLSTFYPKVKKNIILTSFTTAIGCSLNCVLWRKIYNINKLCFNLCSHRLSQSRLIVWNDTYRLAVALLEWRADNVWIDCC